MGDSCPAKLRPPWLTQKSLSLTGLDIHWRPFTVPLHIRREGTLLESILYNGNMTDKTASNLWVHYRNSPVDALFVAQQWKSSPAVFSTLKYLQRAGLKKDTSKQSDMLKAVWYLVYETASLSMPHEERLLLSDGIVSDLRQALEDYSYPKHSDAEQDSSDSQSALDFPFGPTSDLLDESVPFD